MRIAILGPGPMGRALGKRWVSAGHDLRVSASRDPGRLRAVADALGPRCEVLAPAAAAEWADVLLLATPGTVAPDVVASIRTELAGKTLIDCTNPLNADHTALTAGWSDSGAERIARQAPDAYVVKAFNTAFGRVLDPDTRWTSEERESSPICGDDPEAKEIVARLVRDVGLDAVDVGPLWQARTTEALALLLIRCWVDQQLMLGLRSTPVGESEAQEAG